jgi:hypothetical protein
MARRVSSSRSLSLASMGGTVSGVSGITAERPAMPGVWYYAGKCCAPGWQSRRTDPGGGRNLMPGAVRLPVAQSPPPCGGADFPPSAGWAWSAFAARADQDSEIVPIRLAQVRPSWRARPARAPDPEITRPWAHQV